MVRHKNSKDYEFHSRSFKLYQKEWRRQKAKTNCQQQFFLIKSPIHKNKMLMYFVWNRHVLYREFAEEPLRPPTYLPAREP